MVYSSFPKFEPDRAILCTGKQYDENEAITPIKSILGAKPNAPNFLYLDFSIQKSNCHFKQNFAQKDNFRPNSLVHTKILPSPQKMVRFVSILFYEFKIYLQNFKIFSLISLRNWPFSPISGFFSKRSLTQKSQRHFS